MSKQNSNKQAGMVEWYSPTQLSDTAVKTVISTIIGENADPRVISAATNDEFVFFDYTEELLEFDHDFKTTGEKRSEIWIDYVSDVGDGWNPTYSIAYSLARQNIEVSGNPIKRGEILILGGDGVYPTANTDEYEKRLVNPYRTAFETIGKTNAGATKLEKSPHIFALPGNHDWYDSLVSFQKLFFTHIFNDRLFAGNWRTRQTRSYFALKLPHKWWLLGVDLQLQHNIDVPQLKYFERVICDEMKAGDKVIFCVPEPYWVKALKYRGLTDKFEKKEQSIEKIEKIFEKHGVEVRLYLAGDLHHYRRFATEDGRYQKITAGGGGAFLHPTHDFDFSGKAVKSKTTDVKRFFWRTSYPEFKDSKKLDWANLYGFIFNNISFGILTGVLYAFLAFLIHGEIKDPFSWGRALETTIRKCIDQPLALILIFSLLIGLVFFTDSNSVKYRRIAGTIHGFAHLAAIFFLGWLGYFVKNAIVNYFNLANETIRDLVWLLCIIVVCGIGGFFIGSIIMGLYLFISLHIFKRHDNEAFSAMKIEDYKNFLRLHIDSKGDLTVYPFKIEEVAKNWTFENDDKICKPDQEIDPDLIEDPIKIS